MFEFHLPPERIATRPTPKREDAKMMVVERRTKEVHHTHVRSIGKFLHSGDTLVLNEAKVDPARVSWTFKEKIEEILFLQCEEEGSSFSIWTAMVSGKKVPLQESLPLQDGFSFSLVERLEGARARIRVDRPKEEILRWLGHRGQLPLPPYILKRRKLSSEAFDPGEDRLRYQTVFARKGGAVAAPTAGLHFSESLLAELQSQGILTEKIFLGVGLGTFQPLTPEHWESGKLHIEPVSIDAETAERLRAAHGDGRRVIAVGTTATRTLEWWGIHGMPRGDFSSNCDLFLRPPWTPRVVSALLTNFHLPGTSLLALVAGFLGEHGEVWLKELYQEAIAREYRFFSYGDCMLIV